MVDTPKDERARGQHGGTAARAQIHLDGTYENAVPTVFQTAEWVPPAYRQAYLEGAASVLGHEAIVES